MITIGKNLRICSIIDHFDVDHAYAHSVAVEHFRMIMYAILSKFVAFRRTDDKIPIRVASSLSSMKRLVTSGSEVFHTITPFGVMAAEESDDENLGALISHLNTGFHWKFAPYSLNTAPIYSVMKNFNVRDNIDFRVGYESVNYVVGLTLYDESRPKLLNSRKNWNRYIVPGQVYRKMVEMKTIVPRMVVAELCNWNNKEFDADWFIEEMNKKATKEFRFGKELDTGSGHFEVIMYYAGAISYRGATASQTVSDEEGDTDKYLSINRSFVMSVNIPTHFVFGRESDKRLPDIGGDKTEYLNDIVESGKAPLEGTVSTDIATFETTMNINTPDVIPRYELVDRYDFSDNDIQYMKHEDLKILRIDIFNEIILPDAGEKYDFLAYIKDNNLMNCYKGNEPILVIIKSDNINIDLVSSIDEGNFIAKTNTLEKIIKDKNCSLFVYFNINNYREFLRESRHAYSHDTGSMNVKQTT